MRIASGGKSDVGRQRTNNEDSFRIVEALNLFVISDGMGGEAHGEIASAMAVETLVKFCSEGDQTTTRSMATGTVGMTQPSAEDGITEIPALRKGSASRLPLSATEETLFAGAQSGWSEKTKRLFAAGHLANKTIFESAQKHPEQQGMGATLTAAWIDGEKLSIAHVGDSRVYLLRSGALEQLTKDHSLVAEQMRRGILTAEEAERSQMQSVLLRALGTHEEVEVDAEEHVLFEQDILLLCSDGLTRMVADRDIARTLRAESEPHKAADELVALANKNGGADNVTAIVVRMESEKGFFSWLRRGAPKDADKESAEGI